MRETDFICYLDSVLSLKRARFDQEVKTVTNKAAPALEWSSIDEEAFATFNAIPAPRPSQRSRLHTLDYSFDGLLQERWWNAFPKWQLDDHK